jgi:hypothetical protein
MSTCLQFAEFESSLLLDLPDMANGGHLPGLCVGVVLLLGGLPTKGD